MATVNAQITDAVSQTTALAVGQAPATSMGLVYTTMADTIGMIMQNAAAVEQQMQTIATAATSTVCALIIAKGSAPSS